MKEDIFSKFKDYNNELEKILEKKDFSKDSKNLLLSMFYKLETSYNDYETVKRKVKTKQEYLENILENIKYCNNIVLVKPNTEEYEEFIKNKKIFDVDLKLRKIHSLANELSLLSAILELNNFRVYLNENYNLIRNSFPYILNTGNDMDNTEVLRDFNAFSWNINENEIENLYVKLTYENLKLALDIDLIQVIQQEPDSFDVIKYIKSNLNLKYDNKICTQFLNIIFKISIILYIQESKYERKRLMEEKNVISDELTKTLDKKNYINDIIKRKMSLNKKVKNLDLMLNNDEVLVKEFEQKNKDKIEFGGLFNIKHFREQLKREREKTLKKIEQCNLYLTPKHYVENTKKLNEDYELIKNIKFDDSENNNILLNSEIARMEKVVLQKILLLRIKKLSNREEFIDFIYQLRYYTLMPIGNNENLFNDKKYKNDINILLNTFIDKLFEFKIINTISTNKKNDIEIIKNIFFIKTINLEELHLEINNIDKDVYELDIFDGKETLETTKKLNLQFNKKDRIKNNRKIKLFK